MRSPHIHTDTLVDLYVNKRMTLKQTRAIVGMSIDGIRKRLLKAGVRMRATSGRDHAPRPA